MNQQSSSSVSNLTDHWAKAASTSLSLFLNIQKTKSEYYSAQLNQSINLAKGLVNSTDTQQTLALFQENLSKQQAIFSKFSDASSQQVNLAFSTFSSAQGQNNASPGPAGAAAEKKPVKKARSNAKPKAIKATAKPKAKKTLKEVNTKASNAVPASNAAPKETQPVPNITQPKKAKAQAKPKVNEQRDLPLKQATPAKPRVSNQTKAKNSVNTKPPTTVSKKPAVKAATKPVDDKPKVLASE